MASGLVVVPAGDARRRAVDPSARRRPWSRVGRTSFGGRHAVISQLLRPTASQSDILCAP